MLSLKVLAPLCAVSLVFLYSHIPLLSFRTLHRGSTTSHPYCVLYDRPPRTGSSSISVALRLCLKTHGYIQPAPSKTSVRTQLIEDMMALPHDRVALMTQHVYMSPRDIRLLRNGCQRLFYITSASSMRERVWSAVKYSFVGRDYQGEITGEQVKEAEDKAMTNTHWETYLEEYPYLRLKPGSDRATLAWGVPADERLVPDYVIRKEKLGEDLSAILEQLGCDHSSMETRNVHKVKGLDEAPRIPLANDDRLFRWLDSLARNENAEGLQKLNEFAAKPEDRV